jgi:hypothetical protein
MEVLKTFITVIFLLALCNQHDTAMFFLSHFYIPQVEASSSLDILLSQRMLTCFPSSELDNEHFKNDFVIIWFNIPFQVFKFLLTSHSARVV